MSGDEEGLTVRGFFDQIVPLKNPPGHGYPRHVPEWGWGHAKSLLMAGDWYAVAFLSPIKPGDRPVRIEAPLWQALDFNLRDGTVFGPGIHYSGVHFYEAGTGPSAQRALSKEEAKASYEKHIKDVFAAKRRTTTIREDEAWAMAAGVPRERQRALREASRAVAENYD